MSAIPEATSSPTLAERWIKANIVAAIISGMASFAVYAVKHAVGAALDYADWAVANARYLNIDEIANEDMQQTSVEILDTTGAKHPIQRKDVESMQGSELSIMPTGFESLPPDDLKSLLEYLTQPRA
jgi:hypothetical protein